LFGFVQKIALSNLMMALLFDFCLILTFEDHKVSAMNRQDPKSERCFRNTLKIEKKNIH
jgi:hypothetical protein